VTSTTTEMHTFIDLLNWIGIIFNFLLLKIWLLFYISYIYIFILDENEINSNQYSTEAAPRLKIKLSNIPPVLIINDKAFELRGVFCYRQGLSRLRNSVGHFMLTENEDQTTGG